MSDENEKKKTWEKVKRNLTSIKFWALLIGVCFMGFVFIAFGAETGLNLAIVFAPILFGLFFGAREVTKMTMTRNGNGGLDGIGSTE